MRHSIGLLLAVLLTVSSVSHVTAQIPSWTVTIPSPTAASLGKYGDVPVSLYTGLPDITIPLFTARGKTIDLPISLSYHASGLKVEDIGGWVGMGWTLEAGGVITRTVRGLVDEWGKGYYNTGNLWYDDLNWPTPPQPVLQSLTANDVDGEPDKFFFNFAGHSGEFIMGPTSTATNSQEVRTIPYQNWVFSFTKVGTAIVSWVITTEDGTKYTFAAQETNTDQGSNHGPLWLVPYASSWYLTEVRAPGGDVISLAYQPYTATHDMGRSGEYWVEGTTTCPTGQHFAENKYEIVSQHLQSITTAQHIVDFSASNLRSDALSPSGVAQEPFLDLITVKTRANVVLRKFQLQYDYSIGSVPAPRLTLKQVVEQDRNGVPLPAHTFAYAAPTLPARTSFAIDHWGYYNGQDTNSYYVPSGTSPLSNTFYPGSNRNPDAVAMQAGSLTRITYPTGGFSEFIYEPHEYGSVHRGSMTEKKVMAGGLRVAELRTGDGMGNVTIRKYRYMLASEPDRSSGMIEAVPVYQYAFHVFASPTVLCEYYSRSYLPRIQLGGGSPVVYREVTVWNGPNGEYGKSRHEFYVNDRPPEIPVGEIYPFFRHTSFYWRWGQEMRTEEFDSSDRLQRSVLSLPTFPFPPETTRDFRGMAFTSWIPQVMIAWGPFRVESKWKHPSSETTTVYDTTGTASVSKTKTFTYGNPSHAQLTEEIETNSDGTQRITRLKYPSDYATGSGNPEAAALAAMQGSAHLHSVVIERTVSEKVGTTEKVVQAVLTTFRQFLAGQFLPYQRFVLNSPSPIP
jgi:hypothetical protein